MFGEKLIHILVVIAISMVPGLEIRFAIPAAAAFGMSWEWGYIWGLIGNILPIPFLLKYLKPFFRYISKFRIFRKISRRVVKRVIRKIRQNPMLLKYTLLGLVIFVAIPIPGTGVWTGAMIAAILNIETRYAFPALALGAAAAGLIVLGAILGFLHIAF